MTRIGTNLMLAAVVSCTVTGCSTSGKDQSQYMRDGVQYGREGLTTEGKKQGTFRGRWWNYYESGRSFSDGEFHDEAEKDLRTALAKRTKDQRWARTYGLHFVPEYFPNRELGVVLFNQKKYEEAIPYLELSIEQMPSARAAYYLDRVREVLYSSIDSAPPNISFLSQSGSDPLSESTFDLIARVTDDTFIRSIRIGDEPYPIQVSSKSVDIEATVPLRAGTKGITVTATDISGKEKSFTLPIKTDHEGPAISIDRPISLPGKITGIISDPAGIESLLIAGVEASRTLTDSDTTAFSVTISQDQLEALPSGQMIIFTAIDKIGNRTNGPIILGEGDTVAMRDTQSGVVLASNSESIELGNDFVGFRRGGVIALTLAANDATLTEPEINITNAIEGQHYRLEEIVLGMLISSPNSIEYVSINGIAVENLVPDRKEQTISRRIHLHDERNVITISVIDSAGGEPKIETITVLRDFSGIHLPENRLRLAVLGSTWDGSDRGLAEEEEFIRDEFELALKKRDRFEFVEKEDIQEVVDELKIVEALGSKQAREALGAEIKEAEVLVIGKIHRSFDSIEVVLEAIDPVSASVIGYADVAGPNDTLEDLESLTSDLALRFQQLFPIVQGEVSRLQNQSKIQTDLNRLDGVSKNLKCLIYRRGPEQFHEITGESLGFDTPIIATGFIREVKNELSVVSILSDGSESVVPIEDTDLVITK